MNSISIIINTLSDNFNPIKSHPSIQLCDDLFFSTHTNKVLDPKSARDCLSFINSNDSSDWILVIDEVNIINQQTIKYLHDLIENTDHALMYSDEIIHQKNDDLLALPVFKPHWSPHLAIHYPYFGTFYIFKKSAFLAHINDEFKLSFLGLASLISDNLIKRIPGCLYITESTSTNKNTHLSDIASFIDYKAESINFINKRYPGISWSFIDDNSRLNHVNPTPIISKKFLASIIIPTRDKADLLSSCINSITSITKGVDYEIIIVNNNSVEGQTYEYFNELSKQLNIKIVDASFDFNWSKVNNLGVSHASGDFCIFLNNDTVVISEDWLSQLYSYASLPDVAVVGPLLLFPDNTIQHAGVVVGMGGWADHIYKGTLPSLNIMSTFIPSLIVRNVLAVTGACLSIEKSKFNKLGGFDENFIICGSDVEIGIRAHKKGFFNVYNPNAMLYHHESKTRSSFVPEIDFVQSDLKYSPFRTNVVDPYYNDNLSLSSCIPTAKPDHHSAF